MSFNKGKLYLQDVATDPDATNQYIQRMLQYARNISTLIIDRSNWYRIITTIQGSINREIQFVLKTPENYKNLADFIKRIEQTKYLIAFFVRNPMLGRILYTSRRHESYPSRSVYIEHSYNSQPFQRYNNKIYNIRFLFRVYRKDINSKNKGID